MHWYSIIFSFPGSAIFNAYINVDDTTNEIQNFYYVTNNRYVDILLRDKGDYGADNIFYK